jgi:sulfur carrier protein
MKVTINGERQVVHTGLVLAELLRENHIDPEQVRGVAVAVNEEVIPRRSWNDVAVQEGDRIEIVTAKQGG